MKKRLVEERRAAEARGNVAGEGDFELYAHHRARQTDAVLAVAPQGGRACFLGAGNCNDLDLVRLAERLDEIHLVDIDPGALARAAARQPPAVRDKLHLHGGIELTGLLARLGDKRRPLATFADVEAALAPATDEVLARLPKDLDLSVSCCVATQLYYALNRVVRPDDPMLVSVRHAGLVVHLRTMARVVRPGQPLLLVNDLVSTETYPVDVLGEGDLLPSVTELSEKSLVFEAGNPIIVKRILRRDTGLRELVAEPTITSAWLWTGPLERTYLVYAMRMTRR